MDTETPKCCVFPLQAGMDSKPPIAACSPVKSPIAACSPFRRALDALAEELLATAAAVLTTGASPLLYQGTLRSTL